MFACLLFTCSRIFSACIIFQWQLVNFIFLNCFCFCFQAVSVSSFQILYIKVIFKFDISIGANNCQNVLSSNLPCHMSNLNLTQAKRKIHWRCSY
ncbi:hypothetical protein RchiOBHm_Chr3g0465761 [Rosa chinensis]|uniref:Uncharacterized protein n=1 Tax=Rosa chinensis TaxID=74649 RepID=A0A2P6R9T2_ROSCH|nr:hypothetical protein RchiOBHm_Chr3g0465761 [Rosa chinensis]